MTPCKFARGWHSIRYGGMGLSVTGFREGLKRRDHLSWVLRNVEKFSLSLFLPFFLFPSLDFSFLSFFLCASSFHPSPLLFCSSSSSSFSFNATGRERPWVKMDGTSGSRECVDYGYTRKYSWRLDESGRPRRNHTWKDLCVILRREIICKP